MVEEANPILAGITDAQEALVPSGDLHLMTMMGGFGLIRETVRAQCQLRGVLKWEQDIHLIDSIYVFAFHKTIAFFPDILISA